MKSVVIRFIICLLIHLLSTNIQQRRLDRIVERVYCLSARESTKRGYVLDRVTAIEFGRTPEAVLIADLAIYRHKLRNRD